MRILLVLSFFVFVSCASTQKVADNMYMTDCEKFLFMEGCTAAMEKTCPGGYKVLAKKTLYSEKTVDLIHYECTEVVGSTR